MNEIIALFILCLTGTAGVASAASGGGSVTGHVVITKVMTRKRVSLPSYDLRGVAVNSTNPNKADSSDPAIDELSRVILYLEGPGLKPAVPVEGTLTQKNRHFDPEIVVVQVGSTVAFPNQDPIFHNVFSLSKARQFDLGYYPAGASRSVKFEKPGIVQVFCHIHPDMAAAIVVLPSAFWTRPGAGGVFEFSGVPPGAYDLVAWHRSAGFFRRHITISEGGRVDENFVIPVKDVDSGVSVKPGSAQ